jgi:acyl-CoA thioesterase-2
MGSLDADTKLAGGDGRYEVAISPEWKIWGPNGGYMASLALRAATNASRFPRPASFACHFLSVGAFEPASVAVTALRSARTAESLRATIEQNDRILLDAQVWTVADGTGLEHDFAPMPDVEHPARLLPFDQLEGFEPRATFPFWENLDARPTDWVPPAQWKPDAPQLRCWYRFRPDARFDEPGLDAARALILIDTLSWPAACRAHAEAENPWMAPSLDLAARFHRAPPYSEWLLVEARADVATEGLIGFHNRVWDEEGRVVASGGGQLLCRPRPPA